MATLTNDEVLGFLKEWVDSYERGSDDFFDFFSKDASFFTISTPTRIDGVEEYRRGFEDQFKVRGVKRRSQVLSPEIRILGDTAFVSYHNRIAVEGKATNLRASVLLRKDDQGNIKIDHLHTSYQQLPSVPLAARSIEEITVLEERVATAAATVGTPK